MLRFYDVRHSIIDTDSGKTLFVISNFYDICTDTNPETQHILLSWDNINKVEFDIPFVCTEIKKCRKGRKLSFSMMFDNFEYKEWKREGLDLVYKIEYVEIYKSIKEILNYYDGDKAIRYLIERGIKEVE